ncbi:unnamed protein product [Rangifer tarandus platyrhynchus]|uniref:Uncharacterized protein n=2 Tax=Rangifer tarandus platyrhynchus TaxID=3082113 RepID=A0AC59ZR89_RANTA|nr:unnamed protein product [Rangifer tarandus platyrhynchus]
MVSFKAPKLLNLMMSNLLFFPLVDYAFLCHILETIAQFKVRKVYVYVFWWLSGKESTSQCRRRRLDPGSGTLSGIFAWRIPWTEEPGGPQSLGSQRVRYNLATQQQ